MSYFGNRGGGGRSGGTSSRTSTYAVSNIAERDGLLAVQNGAICMVQDASSDTSVKQGFAVYQRFGTAWVKISDENIMRIQNTENIQETDSKRFVTTEEKELITATSIRVDGIETLLDESTLIQQGSEPKDKSKLWLD